MTKNTTSIKIKKITPDAIMPTRGSEYAAGWDLYANSYEGIKSDNWSLIIPPKSTIKIGTGFAIAIPNGCFGGIYARSGLATKQGLAPANKVGVIDSDYRGEVIVALYNHSDLPMTIHKGDRIAQLVVQEYLPFNLLETDELDDTERGESGFGSTGTN